MSLPNTECLNNTFQYDQACGIEVNNLRCLVLKLYHHRIYASSLVRVSELRS